MIDLKSVPRFLVAWRLSHPHRANQMPVRVIFIQNLNKSLKNSKKFLCL